MRLNLPDYQQTSCFPESNEYVLRDLLSEGKKVRLLVCSISLAPVITKVDDLAQLIPKVLNITYYMVANITHL